VNALIPVFVAVLLAEIGGSLTIFGRERRNVAALAMLVLILFSAAAGWSIGTMLPTPARTLLLGLALLFAANAQLSRKLAIADKPTLLQAGVSLYRSPSPFLVFAFASWLNAPVSGAVGAMAGVAVVAATGAFDLSVPRFVRTIAGLILGLAGLVAALNGLRLV
jgi:hypothetical protein